MLDIAEEELDGINSLIDNGLDEITDGVKSQLDALRAVQEELKWRWVEYAMTISDTFGNVSDALGAFADSVATRADIMLEKGKITSRQAEKMKAQAEDMKKWSIALGITQVTTATAAGITDL